MTPSMFGDAQRQREMMANLAARLASQAVEIAAEAKRLGDSGQQSAGWQALGRSIGYTEAAQQILLIARNL